MVKVDFGWGSAELLRAAPYSVSGASPLHTVGLALERQRGVHAIASDCREDFDTWPGALAYTSPGVPIFSESAHGGEYLAVHAARDASLAPAEPRVVFQGDKHAMRLGWCLRVQMLAPRPDAARVEEYAARLLERCRLLTDGPRARASGYAADRTAHARVLEYIDDEISGPLPLEQLAHLAGMPPLRFLRGFSAAMGMTPHAYITERRLQRARALLSREGDSIAAIAADCGFAHQSHLGAALRRHIGLTPRAYRERPKD